MLAINESELSNIELEHVTFVRYSTVHYKTCVEYDIDFSIHGKWVTVTIIFSEEAADIHFSPHDPMTKWKENIKETINKLGENLEDLIKNKIVNSTKYRVNYITGAYTVERFIF